jgi:CDP-paratose 2-epimerase
MKGAADSYVLITGGCGFIGTNLADRLLSEGQRVLVVDNLSRAGVEQNLEYLRRTHGALLDFERCDVRNSRLVTRAVRSASHVFHFSAQVAVTTSLDQPREDFDINCRGTFNVLEAVRRKSTPTPIVFTSTNKVYGALDDVSLLEDWSRYVPMDAAIEKRGVSELRPLDFHSPYGCSKGAADQYVLDYSRSYRVPAVVFRMSCIYGPHQFGNEDQGWVAHFLIRAIEGKPLTLYGDGKQVRDILFVRDLVNAFQLAQENMETLSGRAFNIGGGAANTISLIELLEIIGDLTKRKPQVSFDAWRTGDQRYYVSDTRAFQQATGWRPKVNVAEGVRLLHEWLREHRSAALPVRTLRPPRQPEIWPAEVRVEAR